MKTDFLKTKKEITAWLDKHKVKNYTLIKDSQYGYVVEVNGDVHLANLKLTTVPVKFNTVGGNLSCNNNQLTSLEFCPHTIGGDFYCSYNQLITLKFCPKTVGNHFYCDGNQLTSLEFCPTTVGGGFYCDNNPALKDIQEITDFLQILAIHKKTLIKIEREHIEQKLVKNASNNNITEKPRFKV